MSTLMNTILKMKIYLFFFFIQFVLADSLRSPSRALAVIEPRQLQFDDIYEDVVNAINSTMSSMSEGISTLRTRVSEVGEDLSDMRKELVSRISNTTAAIETRVKAQFASIKSTADSVFNWFIIGISGLAGVVLGGILLMLCCKYYCCRRSKHKYQPVKTNEKE